MHRSLIRWAAILTITVAAGLVAALGRQNRALRQELSDVVRRAGAPRPGIYVPGVRTTTLDGEHVLIGATADPPSRQILFFFTTTCPYCRASLPAWKQIAVRARDDAAIYGVAVDSAHLARAYADEHGLPFPVAVLNHPKYLQFFRVQWVPELLVVQGDGRISYARTGVMETPAAVDSVIAAVHRPTIVPEPSGAPASRPGLP